MGPLWSSPVWLSRSRFGNPLQYSCLENAMDRGAWWAAVHGVAKSWTSPLNHQPVGSPLTRNCPPLPSSSSRMYPSAGTVDRGGCFQDSVALLLWVQQSSSCRMGVAGTGGEAKQKLVELSTLQHLGMLNTHL